MNDPESTHPNISDNQILRQSSIRQRWPRFTATLERLKAHPIGQRPRRTSRIDLEQHADYFESH